MSNGLENHLFGFVRLIRCFGSLENDNGWKTDRVKLEAKNVPFGAGSVNVAVSASPLIQLVCVNHGRGIKPPQTNICRGALISIRS